jgi:hypothetical protein
LKLLCIAITALLLVGFFQSTYAQNRRIYGTIIDAHTKEPVSFASVYFAHSTSGNTTDSAGNFSLIAKETDTVVISYTGYETLRIGVPQFTDKRVKIELERGGLINAVVVKKKFNKGLYLWKKLMTKKRSYNRYNLDNFGYEAYNKLEIDIKHFNADKIKKNFLLKPFAFILDNIDSTSEKEPFLPAYLVESLSDYAYQSEPKKYFERIKASNIKGRSNESFSKLLGVMDQNVNMYGNYINVMDKDFISPFNENADVYYNFYVPDTQIVAGQKMFHFVFNSKHPGQNTFQGDAWVFDKTWQIQKISLYLGKEANVNLIDRISVFQEFTPLNDSVYFLNRDKFFADFRIMGKHSLTLIGRKTTSYRDIVINSDSLRQVFQKQNIQEVVKTDTGVLNKTDSAWQKLRHDTLSANEKAIYTTIDKLLQMPKFQKLERTLRFIGSGYKNIGNYEIGPWFNWISSNSWEGTRFRFDLGTNTGFNKNIYLHAYLAYGAKDRSFKGKGEAYWLVKREPLRIRLHASYANDIDNGISSVGEVSQDNVFSFAIRKPNTTRKFIRVKEMRFEEFNEWGKGFSTEWFFTHVQYDPLKNLPLKSAFPVGSGTELTNFEVALKFRFAYLEKFIESDYFRYTLGSKYPILELMVAKGFSGVMNSAYTYTKVSASVKDLIKVSPLGSVNYKVYAGKVNGTLPFAFLENHPGNDMYYYNPSAFNLMNRFEYISDKYAGVNVEHHIGSGLFRFIPLTRKLKWRQFWNVKALWGSLSPENQALNASGNFKTLNGNTYLEVGTGIDNIFKILRLDAVWRVFPTIPGSSKTSRFGIFGSFQFQF